jgi:hypothetical protein
MMRFMKAKLMFGTAHTQMPKQPPAMAAMPDKPGASIVPAAWPTSVSQFAQAIEICQHRDADDIRGDLKRARRPKRTHASRGIHWPSAF